MTNKECKHKIEGLMLEILKTLQEYQQDDNYFSCAFVGEQNTFLFWNSAFKNNKLKNVEFIMTREELKDDLQIR